MSKPKRTAEAKQQAAEQAVGADYLTAALIFAPKPGVVRRNEQEKRTGQMPGLVADRNRT